MKFCYFFKIIVFFFFFNFKVFFFEDLLMFDFHGKRLDDLLQKIAEIKNKNILLPQKLTKGKILINF